MIRILGLICACLVLNACQIGEDIGAREERYKTNVKNTETPSSETASSTEVEIVYRGVWERGSIYKMGDVVSYEGRLFQSEMNENQNHVLDYKWQSLHIDI